MSDDDELFLGSQRGPLSPPSRRDWVRFSIVTCVALLGAVVDYAINDSLGVAFIAAVMALLLASSLVLAAICTVGRKRLGDAPPTSSIVSLLGVYFGCVPPLVVLGGLGLDHVAGKDPLFGGKGLLVALAVCAWPAIGLALQHWNFRSLRRKQEAESSRRMEELELRANTDSLTGLANRRSFEEQASKALRPGVHCGTILLIDLDRFKPVNDTFGHAAGDLLLQEIARRLKGSTREGDLVARIGGDEFAVLLRGVDSTSAAIETSERIHEALKAPVDIGGAQVQPGASVGLAELDASIGLKASLQAADAAMYEAKGKRRRVHG